MTATTSIHPSLQDVALIDGRTAAASSGCSISHWHDLVRQGIAPRPVIQQHRHTRWRLADVRQWLIARAQSPNDGAAARVMAQAHKTSRAAQDKRSLT